VTYQQAWLALAGCHAQIIIHKKLLRHRCCSLRLQAYHKLQQQTKQLQYKNKLYNKASKIQKAYTIGLHDTMNRPVAQWCPRPGFNSWTCTLVDGLSFHHFGFGKLSTNFGWGLKSFFSHGVKCIA